MASATVGILRVLLSANTAEFDAAMKQAAGSMDSWSKSFKTIGQQATNLGTSLTKAITLPLAGVGAAAIKTGMDFEKVMNSIAGTLQPTAEEMEKVRAIAMKMGADTVFSATDAAEAILELGKAGMDTNTAMESVDEVLQLAAASGFTMAEAAEMSARTLNAFGLEAKDLAHVNDVLAKAVNSTSLNLQDMQVAFGYVGPIAQGFGLSIEQVSAALGIMRDNGIAAETTGRALREGLDRLINPVKSVEEVMAELGIESFETNGKLMNLSEIVKLLGDKGITAGQALKLFGNAAGPGMFALIKEGQPALDQLTVDLEKSEGAAKKLADEMMKGLPGAFERLKGSVETALLAISKAIEPVAIAVLGVLEKLADFVTGVLVPGFQALPIPVQAFGLALTAALAAAGPLLIVFGTMATGLANLATAFGTNGIATKALTLAWNALAGPIGTVLKLLPSLGTVIAALTNPIGLVVTAVVGLGLVWMKWGDDIKAVISSVVRAVDEFFGGALTFIFNGVRDVLLELGTTFSNIASIIKSLAVIAFYEVRDAAMSFWQTIKDNVGPIIDSIKTKFAEWAGIAKNTVVPAIKDIGIAVINGIPGLKDMMMMIAWLSDHTPGWAKSTGEAAASLDALAKSYNTANAGTKEHRAGVSDLTNLLTQGFVPATQQGTQGYHQFGAAAVETGKKTQTFASQLEAARKQLRDMSQADLADLTLAIKNNGGSVEELAKRYGISELAVKTLKAQITETTKATKDHTSEIEKQQAALDKLGIVTAGSVNKSLKDLAELEALAVKGGADHNAVLAAMLPLYEQLANKAAASGVSMDGLTDALARAKAGSDALTASFIAMSPHIPLEPLSQLPGTLMEIDAAGAMAAHGNKMLEESYKTLGITSRAELQRIAAEAIAADKLIQASATATDEEKRQSAERTAAAVRAANGTIPSHWETDVVPRLKRAYEDIKNSLADNLAAMMLGMQSFSEGVKGIWQSIKSSLLGVFSEILKGWIDGFLKSMLTSATSSAGSTVSSMGGIFDGGFKAIISNIGGIMKGGFSSILSALSGMLTSWIGVAMLAIGGLIALFSGAFRGGEEGTEVNPARNAFLAQFGPPGTGEGSGFWNLGLALEAAVGGAEAERLHAALRAADTMNEFNAAVSAINAALGGRGDTYSGNVEDQPTVVPGSSFPGGGGTVYAVEAPEEVMGVEERMRLGLMAEGGYGRVDRPTMFIAGEAGPEDYAFSGANKSFGGMGKLVFLVAPRDASPARILDIVEAELPEDIRANRHSLHTRLRAALEIA